MGHDPVSMGNRDIPHVQTHPWILPGISWVAINYVQGSRKINLNHQVKQLMVNITKPKKLEVSKVLGVPQPIIHVIFGSMKMNLAGYHSATHCKKPPR